MLLGTQKSRFNTKQIILPNEDIENNILFFGHIPGGGEVYAQHLINEIVISNNKIVVFADYCNIDFFISFIERIEHYKTQHNISRTYKVELIIPESEQQNLIFSQSNLLNTEADVVFIMFPKLSQYQETVDKINIIWPDHYKLFFNIPINFLPENNKKTIVYTRSYEAVNPIFQKKFQTRIYMNMSKFGFLPGMTPDLKNGELYVDRSNLNNKDDMGNINYEKIEMIYLKSSDFSPELIKNSIEINTYSMDSFLS